MVARSRSDESLFTPKYKLQAAGQPLFENIAKALRKSGENINVRPPYLQVKWR